MIDVDSYNYVRINGSRYDSLEYATTEQLRDIRTKLPHWAALIMDEAIRLREIVENGNNARQ